MLDTNQKTSLLVPFQIPEFIRDNPEYSTFVLFLKSYYEWMEQNGNVTDRTKNLLNYVDVDKTSTEFMDYFTNDFLPNFPKETLVDKQTAIKFAKELYKSKGTPDSYRFLFKILFNSDFDVFYTKDAVLKASNGSWYVSKSLKLATNDNNWLNTKNLRVFGETTKTIATIENVIATGNRTEVFISNIERLFESGEILRVVDSSNQTVLFDGQPLRAKLLGQISQIKVDPNSRGLLYQPGDPVVLYGGLNSANGVGAVAEVNETTSGSIQRINVIDGGYGYTYFPNTILNITNAGSANAIVGSLDPTGIQNVSFIPTDTLSLKSLITIGNTQYNFGNMATANANTKLIDALSFINFSTYPISSVLVMNGGGGISKIPQVEAVSTHPTDLPNVTGSMKSLGILAPTLIVDGGVNYTVGDVITFVGGSGYGAQAEVTEAGANGEIQKIEYVQITGYPPGGIGYKSTSLPTPQFSITSNVNASGAVLSLPGILGDGAQFSVVVDRAGAISTIKITNYGEDYTTTPNVSLRIEDIVVSNVFINNLADRDDVIYQGANINTATYIARVESLTLLTPDVNIANSVYNLRVYNYNATPNTSLPLKIDTKESAYIPLGYQYNSNYNTKGVKVYGDGSGKATATFLNGLSVGQGTYLSSRGQPSSFDVLQSDTYNNYTYQITVEKEIAKYRDILLNLLHPTGMKLVGRYAMKSNNKFDLHGLEGLSQGYPLRYFTGYTGSTASMTSDFTNKSNNIVTFSNLAGSNIADFIFANSIVELKPTNGPYVKSSVESIDGANNRVTLKSNTWLTFPNVATITANSGSNTINITALTGLYDIVNNGNYSNTAYPLMDIVFAGDVIEISNNTSKTVKSVNYGTGVIELTGNLTANANSYLSVKRTFVANSSITSDQVTIYGLVGTQYYPELITQAGYNITTQDNKIILLG